MSRVWPYFAGFLGSFITINDDALLQPISCWLWPQCATRQRADSKVTRQQSR